MFCSCFLHASTPVRQTLHTTHRCAIVSMWEKQSKQIFLKARFLERWRRSLSEVGTGSIVFNVSNVYLCSACGLRATLWTPLCCVVNNVLRTQVVGTLRTLKTP